MSLREVYYRWWKLPLLNWQHRRRLAAIRSRGHAEVVFLATNLPMWRYDGVLRLMMPDSRFHCRAIVRAPINYTADENARNSAMLCSYFSNLHVEHIDAGSAAGMAEALRWMSAADLIFYPQPYGGMYGNKFDNKYYRDRLLCYIPYAFDSVSADWTFNTALHNQAWRVFRETTFHLSEARRISLCRASNVVVTGCPTADVFANPGRSDVWKAQAVSKKRLIWAPHFSLGDDTAMHRNSFLWLSEAMVDVARRYADRLQIAFKPHPRLYSTLCQLPEWGKERTEQYYNLWATMENTQCERGAYVDLFLQSDAIIHDCGSFTIEYLYTGHPAMFVTHDMGDVKSRVNGIAQEALDTYYIGSAPDDISHFIDHVVLQGNDPRQHARQEFREKYLVPPNGKSVAQNVYDNIVTSIGFQ